MCIILPDLMLYKNTKHCDFDRTAQYLRNNYQLIEHNRCCEIQIKGIRNKRLLRKIEKFFKFDILSNASGKITRREISNLLYRMKKSGFFTKLRLTSIKTCHGQKIIISVTHNIMFTKIKVFNISKRLISYKYIKKLFRYQIGYPQSLYQLNVALHQLVTWYYCRGYEYVTAQIVRSSINPEHVILNISEGVVDRIDFVSKVPFESFSLMNKNINIMLVQKALDLKIGHPLNIKSLELGIQYLINQELLKDCNYTVKHVNHKQQHLIIRVYLFFYPNRTLYLLFEQFRLSAQNSWTTLAEYCVARYFHNYYSEYMVHSLLKCQCVLESLELGKQFYSSVCRKRNNRNIILDPAIRNDQRNLLTLIDLHKWNLLIIPEYIWKFHRYIMSPVYLSYSVNLRLAKQYSILEIRCIKPWINLNTSVVGTIYSYVFKSVVSFCLGNKDLIKSYNFVKYINYFLDVLIMEVGLICKLTGKILITKQFGIYKAFYVHQAPHVYLSNNSYLFNVAKDSITKFPVISEIIKQNYFYFKSQFQYGAISKLEKEKKDFLSLFSYMTCLQMNQDINSVFDKVYFNCFHWIYLKYLYCYRVLVSHSLLNKLEVEALFGNSTIKSLMDSISNTDYLLVKDSIDRYTKIVKQFWLVNCEYQYAFNTMYSGLIFINYGQSIRDHIHFGMPDLLFSSLSKLWRADKYLLYFGLGMQVRSLIKQAQTIRIEYSNYRHTDNQFYIRIMV